MQIKGFKSVDERGRRVMAFRAKQHVILDIRIEFSQLEE